MTYNMSCYGFPVNTLSPVPGRRPNRILPNDSQVGCNCPDPNYCQCGLSALDTSKAKLIAIAVAGMLVGGAFLWMIK